MTNAQCLTTKIKDTAKENGITIKNMLVDCGLSINTLNQMTDKKGISCFSLNKIADYLGVSVDYLLGRTNTPTEYSNGISNVQTTANVSQVSCNNNSTLDETTEQVAKAFQNMSLADKAKVITLIAELTEKNKTA